MKRRKEQELQKELKRTAREILTAEPYLEINGEPVDFSKLKPRSVTLEMHNQMMGNTAGFRALYKYMDDQCFAYVAAQIAANCSPYHPATYDWDLVHHVVPELIRRLLDQNKTEVNTSDERRESGPEAAVDEGGTGALEEQAVGAPGRTPDANESA